jgi:hypothetical protein
MHSLQTSGNSTPQTRLHASFSERFIFDFTQSIRLPTLYPAAILFKTDSVHEEHPHFPPPPPLLPPTQPPLQGPSQRDWLTLHQAVRPQLAPLFQLQQPDDDGGEGVGTGGVGTGTGGLGEGTGGNGFDPPLGMILISAQFQN